MDGAFASARMYGPHNPAAGIGTAARLLIEASRRRPRAMR
jgi:hypothetical protein